MTSYHKDGKPVNVPSWFSQKPSITSKARYKDAVVNFIIDKDLRTKLPKANITTYKAIIPWVQTFERKWKFVTNDNFNTGQYKAHEVYADVVRNLLKSHKELSTMLDIAEGHLDDQQEDDDQGSDDQEEELDEMSPNGSDKLLDKDQKPVDAKPLPASSEKGSAKKFPVSQVLLQQKRIEPFNSQDTQNLEPKSKCCKLEDVKLLFDDFVAKNAEAKKAETLWRDARDKLDFIHSPKAAKRDGQ